MTTNTNNALEILTAALTRDERVLAWTTTEDLFWAMYHGASAEIIDNAKAERAAARDLIAERVGLDSAVQLLAAAWCETRDLVTVLPEAA